MSEAVCTNTLVWANDVQSEADASVASVEAVMTDILSWEISSNDAKDVQSWLDGYASDNPTDGNVETFLLGMVECGCDTWDYSSYESALIEELCSSYDTISPSSLQKGILVLKGLHADSSDMEALVSYAENETIGSQGVMSLIYGLFVFPENEEIITLLLEYQSDDGGLSLTGETGDVDVTAMALQAMAAAGYEGQAMDEAVSFIQENQLASGGFLSYGTENSETTSQVMLAYLSMDMDSEAMALFPVLTEYLTNDGGVSHVLNSPSNEMASSQAFYALTKLRTKLLQGEQIAFVDQIHLGMHLDYRVIGSIILGTIVVLLSLFFVLRQRKTNKKKMLYQLAGLWIVSAVLCALLWLVHFERKEDYQRKESDVICDADEADAILVSFSISADTIGEEAIWSSQEYYVEDGTTVFELLTEICRVNDIQFEYTGSDTGYIYIQGINYIYEFDYGELSGWMYRVNGEFPDKGCGSYVLSDGDVVEWVYTTDLGKDVGDD